MESLWNTLETVTVISKIAQWVAAISAIIALIFTFRAQTIKNRIDAAKELSNNEEKLQIQIQLESSKEQTVKLEEELKITNEKLEKSKNRIHPRKLTIGQRAKLLSELKNITNGYVSIYFLFGDSESLSYANEIKSVFIEAEWEIIEFIPAQRTMSVPRGILMIVHSRDSSPAFSVAVVNIFKSIGIEAKGEANTDFKENSFTLFVGENPNQ